MILILCSIGAACSRFQLHHFLPRGLQTLSQHVCVHEYLSPSCSLFLTTAMTSAQSNGSQVSSPRSPFDDPHADIILLSSDRVEYCMLKADLRRSSAFCESMLSLPQPSDAPSSDQHRDGLPVVHLTDPADLLDVLLAFCLPREPPSLSDLATVSRVLEGGRKYQIDWASQTARKALVALAEDEPLRAYAIACHYGLEAETRRAAVLCLRVPLMSLINSDVPELKLINGEHSFATS